MAFAVPAHEYRSLRYVRGEVQTRAGFGNQIAGLSNGIWNSFVREAHRELFLELKVGDKRTTTNLSMVVGQNLYDFPATVDYRRIARVEVLWNDWWIPVQRRTIDGYLDSVVDTSNYPIYWDVKAGQFEVWPDPDDTYTVRFDHWPEERYLLDPGQDWTAATAYVAGDYVYATACIDYPTDWPMTQADADTVDAFVYKCTTGGTTHASTEPTWPTTPGDTVNDNGVIWTCVENRMQVPSAEVMQLALFKAKSHYRQEDAQIALQANQVSVGNLKAGETRGKVYRRRIGRPSAPYEPWQIVPPKRV